MPGKKPKKILVMDDEKIVRESFISFLEDCDYGAIGAENGREGLELFDLENPDLVLVDLRMPEIDGLGVLLQITKNSPETPIVVVSGTGVISDVVEALRRGAWDYLLKPLEDLTELQITVEKALDRARLIRDRQTYLKLLEKKNKDLLEEISERKRIEAEKERLITRLQKALEEVNLLSGLLPICSYCNKIRDDQGYWQRIEKYIEERSEAKFSHSLCHDCLKEHYPEVYEEEIKNGRER